LSIRGSKPGRKLGFKQVLSKNMALLYQPAIAYYRAELCVITECRPTSFTGAPDNDGVHNNSKQIKWRHVVEISKLGQRVSPKNDM